MKNPISEFHQYFKNAVFLVAIFLVLLIGSAKAQDIDVDFKKPQTYEIAEITVTGAKYLDHNALISLSGLRVGDRIKIPGNEIREAITKLWKQGIVGDVGIYVTKVEGKNVYLNIVTKERPRLTKIIFEGISKSHENDIKENLSLRLGSVVTDPLIKNTEIATRNFFIEKGFLNVSVKTIKEKDAKVSNGIIVRIIVDKKSKIRIHRIKFVNNQHISDARLKKQMKGTKEYVRFNVIEDIVRKIFSPKEVKKYLTQSQDATTEDVFEYLDQNMRLNIFTPSKFIKKEYKNDLQLIVDHYNSKGYRDAVITADTTYAYHPDDINITINVQEGEKYYIRNIEWTGNFVHNDKTLNNILGVEKGDIYNLELINKKLNYNPAGADVSSLYMDNGYLFFRVTPIEVNVENDSIDLEMRIYEGPQADNNRIIIKGNEITSDHVILREVRTIPGKKFSRSDLIRTQQQLAQLGYFDPEQILINPIPKPDGTVDIEYGLVEKPNDQIELSGGWGGYYGFMLTLGLVFNNFAVKDLFHFNKWRPIPKGDGQRLGLRVQASGKQFQSYSITFTEPWLGGRKPTSFTVDLRHTAQRILAPLTREQTGYFMSSGITLALGRRLSWPDDYFTLSNSLSYQFYQLNNFNIIGLFPTGVANNFTFNTTLARNSVNNPTFPQSGSNISLSLSLTPPYSLFRENVNYDEMSNEEKFKWVEYHKWMFDASYFTSIVGKLVLNARAHFGFIGSYNRALGFGPFERFEMGGVGLAGGNFVIGTDLIGLRGYDDQSIGPVITGFNSSGVLTRSTGSGVVFNKFVFELRYPISLNPAATIYVLGYAEAGNNWGKYNDFNPFNLYRSAGVGARVFMPAFGLLGVDWGYGFDTLPGFSEPSGSWFGFTIGQTIR